MGKKFVPISSSADYAVSDAGEFITPKHKDGGYYGFDNGGYKRVSIRGKKYLAHRLVYEAFVGPIPKGFEIDHINTNPSDNRIENLRLVKTGHNAWENKISRVRITNANRKNLVKARKAYTADMRERDLSKQRVRVIGHRDDCATAGPFDSLRAAAEFLGIKGAEANISRSIRCHMRAYGFSWERA